MVENCYPYSVSVHHAFSNINRMKTISGQQQHNIRKQKTKESKTRGEKNKNKATFTRPFSLVFKLTIWLHLYSTSFSFD